MQTKERIDLHMPISWNAMTTRELETIAGILLKSSASADERHPLNFNAAKIEMFLALTELKVVSSANPVKPIEEQYIVVRRRKETDTFNLYLWQIHYWIQESMKWMDKKSTLTRFPYPEYRHWFRRFIGPGALMQNFKWRQYRIACDYMSYYLIEQDQLVGMKFRKNQSASELKKQTEVVRTAKAMFLATIFNGRVKFVDAETKRMVCDYAYVSNQSTDHLKSFKVFPDAKFQCILFWWAGMMNYLQGKYPKAFKEENPKRQAMVNPLDLYTRTTAVMEKYLGINEEKLNRETYTVVLQHINDMAREQAEMDKLNNR
ncbi:hypothetical protein [Bacteroides sp.]|uniref:hypothetical protein n=1 Tax=Bacteroides sp. TaxID=29523 RepID=UPI00263432C2|nr:hypothetical protein [Bacteroides sp.]MDD3037892.1 hypothetical protein [Bacteroides sp.]